MLPLLSPTRTVTLVHAVQRPQAPGLQDGDITLPARNAGETAQTIEATFRFDGASSAQVDLISSWVEYVDQAGVTDPTLPNPHTGAITTITPNATDTLVPNKIVRQLFGDTKARAVTYATRATTRFREYFPARSANDGDPDHEHDDPPEPALEPELRAPPGSEGPLHRSVVPLRAPGDERLHHDEHALGRRRARLRRPRLVRLGGG